MTDSAPNQSLQQERIVMLDTPRIIRTPEQLTAVIHITVPRERIKEVMGPGIGEVGAALVAQGIKPAGPWFTFHMRRPTDTFDFEVGIPVATPVTAVGRVRTGQLPAATVAHAVYQGDYEGLAAAWAELHAWISAHGHTPATHLWECYAVGPESTSDPAAWRTELYRPLMDQA
jgi:effector-binding domain-containing protein